MTISLTFFPVDAKAKKCQQLSISELKLHFIKIRSPPDRCSGIDLFMKIWYNNSKSELFVKGGVLFAQIQSFVSCNGGVDAWRVYHQTYRRREAEADTERI